MSLRGVPIKGLPPVLKIRLHRLRQMFGVTQPILGEACGRTKFAISRYEDGTRRPDKATLENIARFYGISIGDLVGRFGVGCSFLGPENILVGMSSHVGRGCIMDATGGAITVGERCHIGHGCILSTKGFATEGGIIVGDDVRIEPGAVIGPGIIQKCTVFSPRWVREQRDNTTEPTTTPKQACVVGEVQPTTERRVPKGRGPKGEG